MADDVTFSAGEPYLAYWATHPDVKRVASAERSEDDGEPSYEVRLSMRESPEHEPVSWSHKDVPEWGADIDLFGAGAPPSQAFFDRCPNVRAMQLFFECVGDEVYPWGWWAARIWLMYPQVTFDFSGASKEA